MIVYERNLDKMKKSTSLIKSALFLIVCWLASGFIILFFQTCYEKFGVIMCFAFGICSVGACVCIYGDFAWKLGKKMAVYDDRNKLGDNSSFGLALGAVPTAINYIFVILLYLSKLGVLGFDFYPYYKTLTFYFVPWTYLAAPNTVEKINDVVMSVPVPIEQLSWGAMAIATVLPLVFPVTCYLAFLIGYKHIDVKEKFLYGK